jgi:Ca2+/Na+ antiporter
VTFLAFGNGAPDIFSSIAGIRQANPELVIGELYGLLKQEFTIKLINFVNFQAPEYL